MCNNNNNNSNWHWYKMDCSESLKNIILLKPHNQDLRWVVIQFSSIQLLSRVWVFTTPWTPGLPIHHQLPEFTQTHVHCVGDVIQPSHPLYYPTLQGRTVSLEEAIKLSVRFSELVDWASRQSWIQTSHHLAS